MCSAPACVKQEAADVVDLPEMGRGESSRAGAKTRGRSSEPTTPSTLSPLLTPKPDIKEDLEDDLLTSLRVLFDGVQLDDFDDDSDTESEEAPSSPAAKGLNSPFPPCSQKRTYFYALGRLYFYDEDRNVFLDNSPGEITLAHVGKPFLLSDGADMFKPDFFIDGIPYYFDHISGALVYEDQGTLRNVYTWAGESDSSTLNAAFSPTFVPRATSGGVLQSNSGFAPVTFQHYAPDRSPAASTYYDQPKSEGGAPWSPGSSALSPIVSAGSRASSEGLEPLITDHGYGMIAGIHLWQQETKHIQEARAPASNKMDRRRCPQCNKTFRRPSSLEDHLNVHTGNKPHLCPYSGCKTGFATKSNMKRHFLTHRVGSLEEYCSGGRKAVKAKPLTTTYNSKVFHTQRFRLTT